VHLLARSTAARRPAIACVPPSVSVSLVRQSSSRTFGVLDAGEVDLDLAAADQRQLRLGDAERVDALAHDLQRPVQGLLVDLRLLRRGLALVDELDAALEVQAELGLLGRDDHRGGGDQPEDQEQDEQRAAAIRHGPGGEGIREPVGLPRRGQDEQQPAVVVVGREQVRNRLRR
jgi:hypothetical protein